MKFYQIKELSKLTSTTVRTLQHYDEIDLLKPTKRSDAGYRLYSEEDLLKLQQIVTLKYLGLSLAEIKNIFKSPYFDVLKSLEIQAQSLREQVEKIEEASKLLQYIASQIQGGDVVNWKSTAAIINLLEINTMNHSLLEQYENVAAGSELGKKSSYDSSYNPDRLYPIPRAGKRKEIGINPDAPPFVGFDVWNHYEVSWLNEKGKPMVATAEIYYDCNSPFIVESKSLKLYFNSLNQSRFKSIEEVESILKKDLEKVIQSEVTVVVNVLGHSSGPSFHEKFEGECIDDLDVACTTYMVEPNYLTTSEEEVEEILYSDLLKSNCLLTHQPDWGSVQIIYKGKKINREGLLRYLVSFRNHNEFHEQCIERIFADMMNRCKPKELTVYARYTRRGGLDINPYRSTKHTAFKDMNIRLLRQ